MTRFLRFGTFRKLHTIISKQTIKPSSPTPSHLKTHNLSLVDRFAPNVHMPWILFYPNYDNGDVDNLKKSLSQCLTQYYPFAGRQAEGHVDCNDEGIEFIEASQDKRLDEFILSKEEHEMMYQLIPNGLGCILGKCSNNLVEVQLNHFKGGGVAMGVSISHKIADGFAMGNFIKQWASVNRGGSSINPYFLSSSTSNTMKLPEYILNSKNEVKYVTRLFVFPNSKLNELKKKVSTMGVAPTNPTRVEVLSSLIFKCEVDATTTTSGFCKPSNLFHLVNMRNKIIKNNPENAAGNIFTTINVNINTKDPGDIGLNEVVAKLRKEKNELQGLRNIQEVGENFINTVSRVTCDPNQQVYGSSSACGFPLYDVDFGWGKPAEAKLVGPNAEERMFFLMDTPHREGIVARVRLPEEEMLYFQEHKELLPYVNNL